MIDKQLAAFLEAGLAIHIGTRNAQLEPNGVRVTAVQVEDDGAHLVAYVPAASAARVLPDLASNGHAALVFGRVTDDRACQVKAAFVAARAADDGDEGFVMAQWRSFTANLDLVGMPPPTTATWLVWPCIAVRLRATAIFNQTPGPDAGATIA